MSSVRGRVRRWRRDLAAQALDHAGDGDREGVGDVEIEELSAGGEAASDVVAVMGMVDPASLVGHRVVHAVTRARGEGVGEEGDGVDGDR